jgi:hypothetical protein
MSRLPPKPSAKTRTIDLFTGTTEQEEAIAAVEKIAEQEVREGPATPLEERTEAYRDSAFQAMEVFQSCEFAKPRSELSAKDPKERFRVTRKGKWSFLECLRDTPAGLAYAWSGVMFLTEDTVELAEVLNAAAGTKHVFHEGDDDDPFAD